jgi:hypothetical protein
MKTKIIVSMIGVIVALTGVGVWLAFHNIAQTPGPQTAKNTVAPVIRLNIPAESLRLGLNQHELRVGIAADKAEDIVRVEYLIDNIVAASTIEPPFVVTIDVSQLSPGKHVLQAQAYDSDGNMGKSEKFTFTIKKDAGAAPANADSQAVVSRSDPFGSSSSGGGATAVSSHGSSGNSANNGGTDDGDDDDNTPPPVDTTPWPDAPPASICTTKPWNNGPTSAPAGAVAVPAGDNNSLNLGQDDTTYWFAPGIHTLGTGEFSQIIAGDNATYIGAPGAIIDGQGLNKYAFTGSAGGVTIRYLTVRNFISPRDEGVVNHNSGTDWVVEYDNFHNNKGGAVFLGTNNVLRYSCLKDNGQYGFQVYSNDTGGPTNVLLDHNEIAGNNTDDWEAHEDGCGCTGGGKFWDAHAVTITNNYVHDNLSVGLWADTNDTDFLVEGNYIADNDSQGLFYEISYNMTVKNNNFIRNGLVGGPQNGGFPTGAIYLSESGGDSRVAGRTHEIQIYDNNFDNNWSGVILWENADRFCASPNNTSSGTCTMVNPSVTLATCSDPAGGGQVDEEPYYSDCRWKTQNVHVHDNTFAMNKAEIPGCSAAPHSCGLQGIFANSGSSPLWSPYMGSVIQQAITFDQNNTFSDNTYTGDWNFMVKSQDTVASPAFWMAPPYNQDAGSTFNGNSHPQTANFLDGNTATLEGSLGKWDNWFGETISQSTEAHGGTKGLKVAIEDTFWGVQLSNSPGFPATPGAKVVSFWTKGSYTNSAVGTLAVKWADTDGDLIQTNSLPITNLTGSWQKISADVTAPPEAVYVYLTVTSSSGHVGDVVYLDDLVVGDKEE